MSGKYLAIKQSAESNKTSLTFVADPSPDADFEFEMIKRNIRNQNLRTPR